MSLTWITLGMSLHQQILEEVFAMVTVVGILMKCKGFDWSLHFKWDALTAELKAKRSSPIEPIK